MFLFFDVETTGLAKNFNAPMSDLGNWPRVVQLACLQLDDMGNELFKYDSIVKPKGFTIPADAARIHGITTKRAKKEGIDINEVLNKFLPALNNSKILIAHNVAFDQNVLGAEFLRAGIPNNIQNMDKICTMKESTNFCKLPGKNGQYKWPRLSELHTKLFKTAFEDSHNALVDVTMCAKCFFELRKKGVLKV